MPYKVVTPFNTERRRFAVGQIIADTDDLGGAAIADVADRGLIALEDDEVPASPDPKPPLEPGA